MSIFNCELCAKTFTLKHNLTKHTKNIHNNNICEEISKPKVKKSSKVQVILSEDVDENVDSNPGSQIRIIELQFQLKFKELEMEKLTNEFEMKLQLKNMELELKNKEILNLENECKLKLENMKQSIELIVANELLSKIQQQSYEQAQPIQANIVTTTNDELIPKPTEQNIIINHVHRNPISIAEPIKQVKTQKECLDDFMKNGYTIEDCCEKFLNDEKYNKYITFYESETFENEYGTFEKNRNILNKKFIHKKEYSNVSKISQDIVRSFFKSLDKNKLPFLCTDKNKSRKVIYLKTKDGLIKHSLSAKNNDNDNFNKIIYSFLNKSLQSIQTATCNTAVIFKNDEPLFLEKYKNQNVKNYYDWIHNNHRSQIILKLSPYDDKIKNLKENLIEDVKNIMMGLNHGSNKYEEQEEIIVNKDESENESEDEDESEAEDEDEIQD